MKKRQARYYKFNKGLCLKTESDFLGVNIKPLLVLKALDRYKNLSDMYISEKLGINRRSYQRYKAYLITIGLLQVRQLNASTYVYCLGEEAIEADNKLHEDRDYKALIEEVATEYFSVNLPYLIDDDKSSDFRVDILPIKENEKLKELAVSESIKYPFPTSEEIL